MPFGQTLAGGRLVFMPPVKLNCPRNYFASGVSPKDRHFFAAEMADAYKTLLWQPVEYQGAKNGGIGCSPPFLGHQKVSERIPQKDFVNFVRRDFSATYIGT